MATAMRTASSTGSCFSRSNRRRSVSPLHIGHDVEQEPLRLAAVEERQQVGVLQVGGDADLGEEPLGAQHRAQFGVEDLEGDRALVAHVAGEVHGGHAATADLALDVVAAGKRRLQAFLNVHVVKPPEGQTYLERAGSPAELADRDCGCRQGHVPAGAVPGTNVTSQSSADSIIASASFLF